MAVSPPRAGVRRRDPMIAVVAALSLAVHLAFILPMFTRSSEPTAPREIPVEVVQMPPPAPPAPAPAKDPPPKPPVSAQQKQSERQKPAEQQKPAERQSKPTEPNKAAAAQREVAERMERLIGAMPAIALPGEAEAGDEEVSYKGLVLSKVAKAKPEGRSRGIPGAASVSFTLGDAGEIVRCEIVHKSVDPKLDAEAIAMVRRGAPYPPPPPEAARDFVVTLRFAAMD